jgi:hypothetical protein
MPNRYFLDTSALVARYLTRAPGHVWTRDLCNPASGNQIALAEITGAELAAAINQIVRSDQLGKRIRDRVLAAFWQ